ncbi:MAG TPA: flagellar hook capping FlgD N-terminal domain-containing protein [Acidimicrobiales bacterium]|nr:flagellar hook capping FlgD N-terminal domain-containing protein [Acidimicrobiales bacterium]
MSMIPTTPAATTAGTPQLPTATLPAGSPTTTSGANSSSTGLGMNSVNSDTFLKLLVAQMQYQNPSSPVDSTQFLSQTAAFEEVQELGTLQTAITNLVSSQQTTAATSMLGQTVKATDVNGQPVSGVVTGVQLGSNGPVLQIGSQTATLASVTALGSAAAASTGTASTGTASTAGSSSTTTTPATATSTSTSTTP